MLARLPEEFYVMLAVTAVVMIAIWVVGTTINGLVTGWYKLQSWYADDGTAEPRTAMIVRVAYMGRLNARVSYRLKIAATSRGLLLETFRIFAPFQRALLIPWLDITPSGPLPGWFGDRVRLDFGKPVVGQLTISAECWDALRGSASDAPADLTRPSRPDASAKETRRASPLVLILLGLFLLFSVIGNQGALIGSVPLAARFAGVTVSLFVGLWLSKLCAAPDTDPQWKRVLTHVAIPLFCVAAGVPVTRALLVFAAFTGMPPPTIVDAQVTSHRVARNGEHMTTESIATITLGRDGPFMDVRVSQDLDLQLDPYYHPGRDCLAVGIQQGRWGLKLARIPASLLTPPLDLRSYRRCA
ncbi:hypothetical protein ABDK56_12030 [Sphingomonas sp. ASV193]|uniref:hypothetical protein n=1 Tax=Sphingomonas sp. ASV193 TaxID=3144405 RepID=UPI0032E88E70